MDKCLKIIDSEEMEEMLCFQYQRMIRYGGTWHLEKRIALPGCIFVAAADVPRKRKQQRSSNRNDKVFVTPCEFPYLKELCDNGSLIELSKGVIKNGTTVVTRGPLKGRESLIRKIDRHKRTAEIEIPFGSGKKQITIGLEIYEKEISGV